MTLIEKLLLKLIRFHDYRDFDTNPFNNKYISAVLSILERKYYQVKKYTPITHLFLIFTFYTHYCT